jgi:hypothetical protein
MGKALLALRDTEKIVGGLELYLKGLYEVGERGHTIQIVQGHLGEFLTARTYLEKGHKVWWVSREYDLLIEDIGRFEVKTAKCWGDDGKSWANVFGLKLDKFDVFSLVLVNGSNEPFKILCIPKDELKECEKPHTFVAGNNQHPHFLYYDEEDLERQKRKGYEIYKIERKIALHEEKYLVWSR